MYLFLEVERTEVPTEVGVTCVSGVAPAAH